MDKIAVTHESSEQAQRQLQDRISAWLMELLEFPGYREWKNEQIVRTLLEGHLLNIDQAPFPDFEFPKEIEQYIDIVQGYHAILSTLFNVRECEFYFKKYPFAGRNVSREAHLRTCCELFLSRVYQFRERLLRQLKRLDRRTKPKGIPVRQIQQAFDERFGNYLAERNKVHHEEEYTDVQLKAIGIGDLLSIADDSPHWFKIPQGNYLKIRREWVKKVETAATHLDIFVGLVAVLMLKRCDFLPKSRKSKKA